MMASFSRSAERWVARFEQLRARLAIEPAPRPLSRHRHEVRVERDEALRRARDDRVDLHLHTKERREVGVRVEQRRVELRRADQHHADANGHGRRAQRGRVQTERPERVLGADALLAQHALRALPDDRVREQIGRAHDEHAAARLVERARADAREVREERAEPGPALEVPEEARVRGVRVVDDRRGRARRVRDEQVHAEPVQPGRELGVVALLARAPLLLVLVVHLDEVVPVFHERRAHAPDPVPHVGPELAELAIQLRDRGVDHGARRLGEGGLARRLEAGALLANQVRRLVDLAGELALGLGEGLLRRVVEDVELLGAHGLAVQDREGLDAAVHRPHAEAQRLRQRLELMDERAVLDLELVGELGLRSLEHVALDDGGDLLLETLDERVERADELRTDPRREGERERRLGVIEVVYVHNVVRGGTRLREPARIPDDVVFDHHLRVGGDEHVEARLAGAEAEFEGAARDARDELEEARALARGLGQGLGIRADDDFFGAHAERVVGCFFPRRRARARAGAKARLPFGRRRGGRRPPALAGSRGGRLVLGAGAAGGMRVTSSYGHRLGRGRRGEGSRRRSKCLAFALPSSGARRRSRREQAGAFSRCRRCAWALSYGHAAR